MNLGKHLTYKTDYFKLGIIEQDYPQFNQSIIARLSLRTVAEYKKRFDLATHRIHHNLNNSTNHHRRIRKPVHGFQERNLCWEGLCRCRRPKTEVFQDLPYYLLVSNKGDALLFPTTIRTAQRVCLIDFLYTCATIVTHHLK